MGEELEDFDTNDEDVNDEDTNEEDTDDTNDDTSEDDSDDSDGNEDESSDDDSSDEDSDEDKDKNKNKEDDDEDKNKKLGIKTRYKDVKEAFPELFKKFPDLKSAFFREREFASVFATIDDAKEAAGKAEFLDNLLPELQQGKSVGLLKAMAEGGQELVEEYASNILNDLHEFSPQLFYKTVDPVLRQFIAAAAKDAESKKDKNLYLAARYMSKFLTNDDKIPEVNNRRDPEVEREKEKLNNERSQFMREREATFQRAIVETTMPEIDEIMRDEITLDDVEGDEYKFNKLLEDVFKECDKRIKNDPQHMKYINSLHRRAAQNGYQGQDIINRIRKSYTDKFRLLVPSIKAKIMKQASVKPKNNANKNVRELSGTRRVTSNNNKNLTELDPKKIDWSKTSDEDILSGKATIKK